VFNVMLFINSRLSLSYPLYSWTVCSCFRCEFSDRSEQKKDQIVVETKRVEMLCWACFL